MNLKVSAISLLLLITLSITMHSALADTGSLTMMWWNVENLFDTVDDPETKDTEFTPEGKKQWTEKKLLLKCMRLAHVIKVVKLRTGSYPDILALCEVENRDVFNYLLTFLPGNRYRTAYHASNDPRGIDIAVAYDSTSVRHLGTSWRKVPVKKRNTRDISLYNFSAGASPFHLILSHWPSRSLDTKWSEPQRILAAETAKGIIDSLRIASESSDIIVMGDFNDNPGDRSVSEILNATTDKNSFMQQPDGRLFNCWGMIDGKGSCYFAGKWLQFDQIMVSAGLFDNKGLGMQDNAFSCFSIPHMQTGKKKRPYATYRGQRYLGGYSDHFPLLLQLRTE